MRWDGALESRGRLAARYAELIGLRRELGWDCAEVVSCDANGPVLTMVIATGNLRFEGWFRMGGAAQGLPEGADDAVVSIRGGTGGLVGPDPGHNLTTTSMDGDGRLVCQTGRDRPACARRSVPDRLRCD